MTQGMDAEVKQDWIKALRSGEFVQGKGYLCVIDKDSGDPRYCCLGVLCEIHRRETAGDGWQPDGKDRLEYLGARWFLPDAVFRWANLNGPNPSVGLYITLANDDLKLSFNEIADLIEEHL